MHNLLIVAHEFPPICDGKVMRMLKFAKYLPDFGWRAAVLTVRPHDAGYRDEGRLDPALLREVEGRAEVCHRASPLERLGRWLAVRAARPGATKPTASATGRSGGASRRRGGFPRRFYVYQDESAAWLPFAYVQAMRLLGGQRYDAILTTSPPHLLQLLGPLLKARTRLPWVADFRDGWADNFIFQAPSPLRQRMDRRLERGVLKRADAVVVVREYMRDAFLKACPACGGKVHVIRNGYDPADFQDDVGDVESACFAHIGSLGAFRDPRCLLAARDRLRAEGRLPQGFRLRFIGSHEGLASEVKQDPDVEMLPSMPHREAVARMRSSGVLLMIAGKEEQAAVLPGKIFEYLAARRPILAIMPRMGELNDMLSSYSLAVVAPPDDPEAVWRGILRCHEMAVTGARPTAADEDLIGRFDRRQQAEELAALLNGLCGGEV